MFKKILLPVDQANYNEKTLAVVKDFAIKNSSEVIIFHAQDNSDNLYWGGHPVLTHETPDSVETFAKDIVEKISQYFEGTDIKVVTRTAIGDPPSAILKQLDLDPSIDIIIMNTHGMSVPRRFLLGSVTNKIVHHATVPVLVMR